MNYKTKHNKPTEYDIYNRAVKQFGVSFDDGTIFTIGDTIYSRGELSDNLIVHERTHIKQQKEYGVKEWWDRYFEDEKFRFEQEVEAYQNQYKHFNETCMSSNKIDELLRLCALCLSGSMYGNLCGYGEALKLIKN